ncbi:conserved hypothetical protein [Rhodospirillaceae bacterium LM-1]|nr:conserved hypothetical protein [Rhodospirillaceae bacterium LM-1]
MRDDAMTNDTILPSANIEWGMWGTSQRNGYDALMCWKAASRFLAATFKLKPEQVRDLLDHRFGRHLADDFSFIPGGPSSEEAIKAHLAARFAQPAWCDWVRITLKEIKAR